MTFNNKKIDREGRSYKWNEMIEKYPSFANHDVVPFTVAEMEWETAPVIKEALKTYVDEQILGYTLARDSYYQATIDWFKNHYDLIIKKEDIVIIPGVITAVKNALEILTQENDGVILTTPVYHSFFHAITQTKRRIVTSDLINIDGNYHIDFDDLEDKFKEPSNTVMILCQPHNPIGRIWTREELEHIHELSVKYNVPVISDEIHADLVMPGHKHISYGLIDEKAILCTSVSKTFNLAGLKLSNIIIKDLSLRNRFINHSERYGTLGANALAIHAAETAYQHGESWLVAANAHIQENYDIIKNAFANTEFVVSPLEATYLVWIDCNNYIKKDAQFLEHLTEHAYFFTNEGHVFGENGNGFVRVNIAVPRIYVEEACNRILDVVNKL